MPNHLLALVPCMALMLAAGGLRTDRLSPKELKTWNKIVEVVMAKGADHQPFHPTLRRLWDAVDRSEHVVYVEMPRRKGYIAGRFAITKVDPEGKAHEAVLMMNFRAIDNAATGPHSARAGGFIPFKGLGKRERYAELLGHELAHAVWTFAEPERARLVMPLQSENEQVMRRIVDKAPGADELRRRASELDRLSRMLEESANAAEMRIWEELLVGQRRR